MIKKRTGIADPDNPSVRDRDDSIDPNSYFSRVFPKWRRLFIEFTEFRETEKITEAWIRINLTVFSASYVSVAQW